MKLTSDTLHVQTTIGISSNASVPRRPIIDTGTGATLIDYKEVPTAWRQEIRNFANPRLVGANGEQLEFVGILKLYIRLREATLTNGSV